MLPLLASVADASSYGYTVADAQLRRASTRVRGFLRQEVTSGTSTVVGMGPTITLPQSPLVTITSVKDAGGADVSYQRYGSQIDTWRQAMLTVVYTHGLAVVPDELVELVAAIASRMASAPDSLAQGVQAEATGPNSITYGMDAWQAQSGLTAGEKATLRRYWPALPRTISVGSPASLYPRMPASTSAFDLYPR